MFEIHWLRRWIRRNTRKIPVTKAVNWKQRLSIFYVVFAWNAFGAVVYMCVTGRHDWMKAGGYGPEVELPPARSWANILGIKNAQVIRVSGLKVAGTYEIKESQEESEREKIAEDEELITESK